MTLLHRRLQDALDHRKTQSRLRQLKPSPPESVDFSSNDFLSLGTTKALRQDYISELQQHDHPLGSMGSRLLDGNSMYAEQLERDIAHFHGGEAGLLTNSGFDANVSIFMCIPQPGDIVVYDELIHASVYDGLKQSRVTETAMFKHNCLQDLEQVLLRYSEIDPHRNVFIAVESVYSMDGDLAPLREIVTTMKSVFSNGNCHLIVDEAHATGVYGPNGRGRVSELGLEDHVLIRLHTFGKALACNGAIILCPDVIKQYLLNYARPLIYTTFMSYPSLTAIHVVYQWLQAGRTEELARRLFELVIYMHNALQQLQSILSEQQNSDLLNIASDCPASPIFALITKKPRQLASHCQAAGFIVRAVVPPTVPEGTERVRICLHAGNTFEHIDKLVFCIKKWLIGQTAMLQGASTPTQQALLERYSVPTVGAVRPMQTASAGKWLPSKL